MATMNLPVKLTKEERLSLALEQAVEQRALEAVEAEKKAADAGFNATIKRHKKSIHERNEGIDTGIIDREVPVRQLLDVERGRVKVIRLDTFEVVSDRPMDDAERQLRLEGTGESPGAQPPTTTKKTAAEDAEKSEEQTTAATPEEAEKIRSERLAEEAKDRIMTVVSGLMLLAKVEDAGEGAVTIRVEEGEIVAEATSPYEQFARGKLAQELVRIVTEIEVKKAAAAMPEVKVASPEPSAFCLARYDAIAGEIIAGANPETGAWVAKYETPLAVMEAEGDDEAAARAALRAKLLAKFAEDEAKLAGGSAPPKTGLKAPPKNGKGATHKRHDDGPPPEAPPAPPEAAAGDGAAPKPPAPDAPAGGGAAPEGELCTEDCAISHIHTEKRMPF